MKAPYLHICFLTSLLLLTSFFGKAQHSKEALKSNIWIQQGEIRLDSLMRVFSRQSGFEFSFNSKKISPSKKVPVAKKTQTVSEWLNNLRVNLGIEHKFVGNHIILVDNPKQGISKSESTIVKKTPPQASKSGQANITKVRTSNHQDSKAENATISTIKNEPITSPTDSSILAAKRDEPLKQDSSSVTLSSVAASVKDSNKAERPTPITLVNKADNEKQVVEEFRAVTGYSKHGSGDMHGVIFGAEYARNPDKRFFLTYQLKGGFNSSRDKITFNNTITGTVTDASLRFSTGGVQIGVLGSLNIIRSSRHRFQVGIGTFGRYQTTSNDGYALHYPTTTGIPAVLVELYNPYPQHTVALGGIIQLQYQFYVSRKMFVGLIVGFQTDTNGDAIPQAGLVLGRSIKP